MMPTKATELQRTDIVPSLDSVITPDRNLIYCATFQIVWNCLIDEIIKSPIILADDSAVAQVLNRRLCEKEDISADCYLAMAGFGKDGIVEAIKRNLREKFNREPGFELQALLPNDILTYAYLEKSIPFDASFEVFDKPLLFCDNEPVESFGIFKPDVAESQVEILDYSHPDDFVLKFHSSEFMKWETEGKGTEYQPKITDDIVLAKILPKSTLLGTVKYVMGRIQTSQYRKSRLDSYAPDILQIPKIDFDILRQYFEVEGLLFLNKGFQDYRIAQALQAIRFRLDETGAQLSSEGFFQMLYGISDQGREFILDKPFLLYFREKQARYPYLALWISNSELLVK